MEEAKLHRGVLQLVVVSGGDSLMCKTVAGCIGRDSMVVAYLIY